MRLIVAAVVTVGLVCAGPASATTNTAKPKPAGPKVLHPNWRLIWDGGVGGLGADGRYVLIQFEQANAAVLIDDQTGQEAALSAPFLLGPTGNQTNCSIDGIGLPWVFADCADGRTALYSISRHSWRVVPAPTGYFGGPPVADHQSAVGRDGIEWFRFIHEGPCCNTVSFYYQDIATGQVRADPTTPTMFPDLDSPSLARAVCSPLRVPSSYDDHIHGLGSLMPVAHGFVMARSQLAAKPNPNFSDAPSGVDVFLERCGSRLHRAILEASGPSVGYPAANAHTVIWPTPGRQSQLTGLFLPGLQRFVIQTPFVTSRYVSQFVAGSRNLYAMVVNSASAAADQGFQVWETRDPRAG